MSTSTITVLSRARHSSRLAPDWLRRMPLFDRVGIALLALLTLMALLGPIIAPHSPLSRVAEPFSPPAPGLLFGSDELGRDVFSRVLSGIQSTWFSALAVTAIAVIVGGTVGLIAGAAGGLTNTILMRITDLFLALPGPVLAIAVVAALGPSLLNTLVAVSIVWWPLYARIMRGEIAALAVRPHLEAARLAGVSPTRRATHYLLPGAAPTIITTATLDIGLLIMTLTGLSFLGLGQPAPSPELGAMTARGFAYLLEAWWIPVFPGLAVAVLALIANLAGDSIRDLLEGH